MAKKKSQAKLLEEVSIGLGLAVIHPSLAMMPEARELVRSNVKKAAKKVKEKG